MDVSTWLKQLGLEEYAESFASNHIDLATLAHLTADDLRELGVVSVGHRRRLLAAIAQIDATAPPPASEPFGAERRPVTVLFADLCNFTTLSRELPDESLHRLVALYLAAADEAIMRNGGAVDKHIGDAAMGLFGAPVAHDDDALRALRAAMELRERMPKLSRQFGRELAMHAGLAVGEVIVGGAGGAYTALGESVNLAARLTDLAPAGEILASEAVRRALVDRAQFETLGKLSIKGFAEPVEVWRLVGLTELDSAALLTPFVGRGPELAQIAAMLDSCAQHRSGGLIYIRGEPGIGKSRLAREARSLANLRSIPFHVCHVLDFGAGRERDPLRRLTDSLLGLAPDADPDQRSKAISEIFDREAMTPRLQAYLHDLAEAPLTPTMLSLIDASDDASRLSGRNDALSLLVRRALSKGPTLVLVEDLHWADAALVETLLQLAHVASDRPLALALTSRPENEQLFEALRVQPAAAPLITIDLGPLRPHDTAVMVGHLTQLPQARVRQYVERAGGNPLFLEELLHNAAEAMDDLPLSLRGLVVARVDRLAPADRAAMHAAAVLGQRFDPAALRAVIGNPSYDPVLLVRTRLLRIDRAELVFAHALIREAVQRSLLIETQHALHARAAEWFKERDPMLRALHLDRGGSPGAADAYREAAEDRMQRYRSAEALPLVERGLELVESSDGGAALLLLKGDVLLDGGRAREALAAYQLALSAGGDERGRALAFLGSAAARRILDELTLALEDVDSAQALAKSGGWVDIEARCHFVRGNLYFPLGRVEECLIEHRTSLELAERLGDSEIKARALGGLGDAEYARGNIDAGGLHYRHCVEESRRIGLGRVEVSNQPMYAHTGFFALDLEGSLAAGHEGVALALEVGQKRAEMIAHHVCIGSLLELGRQGEARAHVERTRVIVRELEAWRFEPENLAFLADVELEDGRPDLARPLVEEGLTIARRTAMAYWGPALLAYNARVTENADAREAFLAEAETLLAGGVLAHNQLLARRAIIELGWEKANPALMEEQCAKLAHFYADQSAPLSKFVVRRGRVLAAALRGVPSPEFATEARALIDWSSRIGAARLRSGLENALQKLDPDAR